MLKVLVGFLVAAALAVEADEKTWDLKFSDPDRDGKFLNVPIFYGNWVPITKAKAAIDYVAASLDDSARRNDEVPLQPQTEPPPPVTETPAKPEVVSQDEILDRIEDPSQISYTHYRRPVIGPEPLPFGHDRHHQGHVRRPLRRQDHPKGNRWIISQSFLQGILIFQFQFDWTTNIGLNFPDETTENFPHRALLSQVD